MLVNNPGGYLSPGSSATTIRVKPQDVQGKPNGDNDRTILWRPGRSPRLAAE